MALSSEQIAMLAKIKEFGPGSPEAVDAFAEYEKARDEVTLAARVAGLEEQLTFMRNKLNLEGT